MWHAHKHKLAFVLGGGGARGALQAGALRAVLEHDIRPDLLVGTSAGAANAAFLGLDPTCEQVARLEDIWRAAAHTCPGRKPPPWKDPSATLRDERFWQRL